MKNKKNSFLIAFLLLSMTCSMTISVKAELSYDYNNTYFEYDVAEGDSFEFNMNYVFNFTASSTFYDEMDTWLVAENLTQGDFSSKTFVNDLETFLEMDYKLKFDITEMYSQEYSDTSSTGDSFEQHFDIFNGSTRADLNEGNGWETPDVVIVDKLQDSLVFMEKYLNETEYDLIESNVTDLIDQVEDPLYQPDWDNSQIYGINSMYSEYYSNGTLKEDPPIELADGTIEPTNPFSDFGGPSGLPLFFPTEMSFEEYYDYATDMFAFQLLYNLENNTSIDPFVSNDTLQSVLADEGVSNINVNEKSVGFVLNLEDFDPFFPVDYMVMSEPSETDNLTEYGITDKVGTVIFAVEYDNDWALTTFVIYVHMDLTLDTTEITEAPDLNNEDISIDIIYSIAREGVDPPTEEDIQNGDIGVSRFVIPGFPIWFVGLFGIISIAALVVKHRK